ncbi:hypothetical protein Tco_0111974 [Tanacetum coccineum]
MLAIQAEEGEGSGHPSEPQPPSSTAQPTHEEAIPNVTSEPIPNVPDEAVYEEWDGRVEKATTTSSSLEAEKDSGNINRTQSMEIPNVPLPQGISACGSPRCQEAMGGSIAQTRSERVPTQPYDSPLPRVNTLGSDEGSMTLLELMVLCTTLSKKGELRGRLEANKEDDKEDLEDSSKHGRILPNKDQLGKFDKKDDDGFFLGYSLVAKAFRVLNIRRQEMKETYHVTLSEDDEAITKSSTKGDEINFNESRSSLMMNFLYQEANITISDHVTPTNTPTLQDINSPNESLEFLIVDDHPVHNEPDNFEPADDLKPTEVQCDPSVSQDITILEPISEVKPLPTNNSPSTKASMTTRSRIRDSEAASAHECLYVNFLPEIEPKKLIEALEEEG